MKDHGRATLHLHFSGHLDRWKPGVMLQITWVDHSDWKILSCFFLLFGVRYGIWWSNFHSLFQQNMEGSSRNRGLTCLNHTCPPQNQIPTVPSGLLLFANNIQGNIIWFYIHMLCWFIFSSSSKFKGRLKRRTNKSQSRFITSQSPEFVMLSSPTTMVSAGNSFASWAV